MSCWKAIRSALSAQMIKVGQRVSFIPHYMKEDKQNKDYAKRPQPVEGKVFMVNDRGVIFVEYEVSGVMLPTTFLPVDIGHKVRLVK